MEHYVYGARLFDSSLKPIQFHACRIHIRIISDIKHDPEPVENRLDPFALRFIRVPGSPVWVWCGPVREVHGLHQVGQVRGQGGGQAHNIQT